MNCYPSAMVNTIPQKWVKSGKEIKASFDMYTFIWGNWLVSLAALVCSWDMKKTIKVLRYHI